MASLGNQTFIGQQLHPEVIRRLDGLISRVNQIDAAAQKAQAAAVTPAQVKKLASEVATVALNQPLNIQNATGQAASAQPAAEDPGAPGTVLTSNGPNVLPSYQVVPPPTVPAWTPFTPAVTNLTSPTFDCASSLTGKTCDFRIGVTATASATPPTIDLPFAPKSTNQAFTVTIMQGTTTVPGTAVISGSTMTIQRYDNVALSALVYTIIISGQMEIL